MRTLLMFAVGLLFLSGLALSNGQESVTVSIHVKGVTGTAVFTWEKGNVTIAIRLSESLGGNLVIVEIKPFWVDYDVDEICSSAQLGSATSRFTTSANFIDNAAEVIIQNVESLPSLGGHSILLSGRMKHVCANIESTLDVGLHDTAVAQFKRLIQGTVYFRQSINGSTRIVTDLYSSQNSYFSEWFIANPVVTCPLNISPNKPLFFNPKNSDSNGCSPIAQESCAVGELSGKHGSSVVGGNKGENKVGYTDNNLPSVKDLNGLVLVIKTFTDDDFDCAVIKVFTERKAIVEFNHDGVTGSVTFTQTSPFDPTTTSVNLMGLNYMLNGFHVHLWPTPTKSVDDQDLCGGAAVGGHFNPFNKNPTSPSYPAQDASTDDMYEVGDLSSKYGTLERKSELINTYTDWNLPLFGSNSIIGRSLVLHCDDSSASRFVCANIEPYNYSVVTAIAVLKYPVIGQIMFMQGVNQSTETSIFLKLDYNNGQPGTKNHRWGIRSKMATNDMLSTDEALRCYSAGSVYDPLNVGHYTPDYHSYCRKSKPFGCQPGDLSGRLVYIDIRNDDIKDTATRYFFTDLDLPLSGPYSIIGKSVFIMNEAGNRILACANIQRLHEPYLIAKFSMRGIGGSVSFRQKAHFGATKTAVTNFLTGFANNHRLLIYELPPADPNNMCFDLGKVFNPFNIVTEPSLTDTDDKYMVGDLAHYGSKRSWNSYNLPLTGLASINQRSLVVTEHGSQNKLVACAKIIIAGSSPIVEAVSTFTGVVTGTIHLFQTIHEDGTMSDTSILVDLKNRNNYKSQYHNWNEHSNPVQDDVHADQDRCKSAKEPMDPYMAKNNPENYAVECRPENPLRCEIGDQASKLGTYDIGEGRKMYTDVDLPLSGKYSGLGRSIVVHQKGKVLYRYACADILPVISDTVTIELKNTTSLDRLAVAQVYAKAIMANSSDVVLELISKSNEISKLKVHFVGLHRTDNKNKFVAIVNGNDKSRLAPYIPDIINAACHNAISTALLLAVCAVQLLNYSCERLLKADHDFTN